MVVEIGLGWSVNHVQSEFPLSELPRRAEETVLTALDSGFSMVKCAHHWGSNILQPLPVISYLAGKVKRMHFATSIFLLPQHNPVDIAAQAATIDILTNGHFTLGVGLGYREAEFEAAGIPRPERAARLEESITLIRALWTGKGTSYKGQFYQASNLASQITPINTEGIPIWIGAQSPLAVKRAGRIGDGWIIPGFYPEDLLSKHIALFEMEERKRTTPHPLARVLMRSVVIGKTRQDAINKARTWLEQQWQSEIYRSWGLQEKDTVNLNMTLDEILDKRALVGDVDQIIQDINRYINKFSLSHFIPLFRRSGINHKQHLEQIKFYGKEVLPYLNT